MDTDLLNSVKLASRRELVHVNDDPTLLSKDVFPFNSIYEFHSIIKDAFPIDSELSSNSVTENDTMMMMIDTDHSSIDSDTEEENDIKRISAVAIRNMLICHAKLLVSEKCIIPKAKDNILLHLTDLQTFVNILKIVVSHKNNIWQDVFYPDENVSSLYKDTSDLACKYWSVYTQRRCTLEKDIRSLWWIILCKLWVLLSWEWRCSNHLVSVYNNWCLVKYLTGNNEASVKFFDSNSNWFNPKSNRTDSISSTSNVPQDNPNNILDDVIIEHIDNLNGLDKNILSDGEEQAAAMNMSLKLKSESYIKNRLRTISRMTMSDTSKLLFDIHGYWREIHWTPNMELLILCLWKRICTFMFDLDEGTIKCMNYPLYVKVEKPSIPSMNDPLPKHSLRKQPRIRFIRDTERILWRHLITIETHWFYLRNNVKKDISRVFIKPGSIPEGCVDELCCHSKRNPVAHQLTNKEYNNFYNLIKNVLDQPECGKLIRSSFQTNAFTYFLFPGEIENHIEHDPTLDRRPQSILSLARRGEFGFMAELIQHEKVIDVIVTIMKQQEYNRLSNTVTNNNHHIIVPNISNNNNNNSTLDIYPEFIQPGIVISAALIYYTLYTLNNISQNTTNNLVETLIIEEIATVYSSESLFKAESNINDLYNTRKKLITLRNETILNNKKKKPKPLPDCYAKTVIGLHLDELNAKPVDNISSWFWLENIDNERDTKKDKPIACKVLDYINQSKGIDDEAVKYPLIVNVRGEFWLIDGNRFFVRTKSLLQALKWWMLRLAFISPKQYNLLGDIILAKIFGEECKKIAAIRSYIDDHWIAPFNLI